MVGDNFLLEMNNVKSKSTSALDDEVSSPTEELGASSKATSRYESVEQTKRRLRLKHKRRLQSMIYNLLERPKTCPAAMYHVLVFLVVLSSLVLSVVASVTETRQDDDYLSVGPVLFLLELCIVVWFSIEMCLRVWSAGCISRYQTCRGRLLFCRRPFCVMDSLIILATISTLVISGLEGERVNFAAQALRGLRFFQILRMARLDRKASSWRLLGSVVWAHRQELFTAIYIGFLFLIFLSFLMFLAEKEENKAKFGTYADALWWGVVTLCTVGYGDTVPETWVGKLIASLCSLIGISFFALPAGILGSGFALKVQQQHRLKHRIRRRAPAANLIETSWRCFAVEAIDASAATWRVFTKPYSSPLSKRHKSNSFASRMSRYSKKSIDSRHKNVSKDAVEDDTESLLPGCFGANGSPNGSKKSSSASDCPADTIGVLINRTWQLTMANPGLGYPGFQHVLMEPPTAEQKPGGAPDLDVDAFFENHIMILTDSHKNAIRAILRMKFFVAQRKFREAQRPYDVKDIIEQYSSGHTDMLARIRGLHYRLDAILGRQSSSYGSVKKQYQPPSTSLSSRIIKVERRVGVIEDKIDILIKMCKEDRSRQEEILSNATIRRPIPGNIHPRPFATPGATPVSTPLSSRKPQASGHSERVTSPTRHRTSNSSTATANTNVLEVPGNDEAQSSRKTPY